MQTPEADIAQMETEARLLAQQRKKQLDEYYNELDLTISYLTSAIESIRGTKETASSRGMKGLIDIVAEQRLYIEESIFWVRSVTGSTLPNGSGRAERGGVVVRPRGLVRRPDALGPRAIGSNFLGFMGSLVLIVAMLAARAHAPPGR